MLTYLGSKAEFAHKGSFISSEVSGLGPGRKLFIPLSGVTGGVCM